jgi:hypothetical protein
VTIAQQFIAGNKVRKSALSPVGTTEQRFASFSRPYGTQFLFPASVPSHKWLGYYQLSLTGQKEAIISLSASLDVLVSK